MGSADDAEILAVNNRRLEKENEALRLSLWDEYAKAALTGLLSHYGDQANIVDADGYISMRAAAADHADQMLAIREERMKS